MEGSSNAGELRILIESSGGELKTHLATPCPPAGWPYTTLLQICNTVIQNTNTNKNTNSNTNTNTKSFSNSPCPHSGWPLWPLWPLCCCKCTDAKYKRQNAKYKIQIMLLQLNKEYRVSLKKGTFLVFVLFLF